MAVARIDADGIGPLAYHHGHERPGGVELDDIRPISRHRARIVHVEVAARVDRDRSRFGDVRVGDLAGIFAGRLELIDHVVPFRRVSQVEVPFVGAAGVLHGEAGGFERARKTAAGEIALFSGRYCFFDGFFRRFTRDLAEELPGFAELVDDAVFDICDVDVALVDGTGAVDGDPRGVRGGGRIETERSLRRFGASYLHTGVFAFC